LNVYVNTMRNNTQEFDPCNYIKDNDVLFNENELNLKLELFCSSDYTFNKVVKKSSDIRREKEVAEFTWKRLHSKLQQEFTEKKLQLVAKIEADKNSWAMLFGLKSAVENIEVPSFDSIEAQKGTHNKPVPNIEQNKEYNEKVAEVEQEYAKNLEDLENAFSEKAWELEEEYHDKIELIENSKEETSELKGDLFFEMNYNKKDLKSSKLNENYDYAMLNQLTFTYDENLRKDIEEPTALPIVVFYSINRLSFDFKEIAKREHTALSAYDNALDGLALDYNLFFRWYKWQKDTDIFKKTNVIQHIDKAILGVMNDADNQVFSDLLIEPTTDIREYRLVLKKGNVEVEADQLSSGEKSLMILIADIARRLCLLNPKSENPLHGQGIVLIDEIDLHLHPKLQRQIIPKLQAIFPNIQFVVTTHSPLVISNLFENDFEDEEKGAADLGKLLLLDNGKIKEYEHFFGRDIKNALYEFYGEEARPRKVQKAIDELMELIDYEHFEEAKIKLNNLKKYLGDEDPAIFEAETSLNLVV
jgi:hypothetical protein